jgi:hypothetical protein
VTPLHSTSTGSESYDDVAVWDLYLLHRGLWHMHGTIAYWTAPYRRQREALADAEKQTRARGLPAMIVRLHNHLE